MFWKDKIILNKGEELVFIGKFEGGSLGQEERSHYHVIDKGGVVVAKVKYTEFLSISFPFKRCYSLEQFSSDGDLLISKEW